MNLECKPVTKEGEMGRRAKTESEDRETVVRALEGRKVGAVIEQ